MTAQLELFSELLPLTPGAHRQWSVVFTGYGDYAGRECRVPSVSPGRAEETAGLVAAEQHRRGMTPDAQVQWRAVTCGVWENQ